MSYILLILALPNIKVVINVENKAAPHSHSIILKNVFIDFRENGRQRERERNTPCTPRPGTKPETIIWSCALSRN